MDDKDIIKILIKFRDYLDIADWFTGALRTVGWVIISGLSYMVDLLSKGIKEVYKLMGFLSSDQMVDFLSDYKAITFALATVAVAFLGWRIIVLKQVDYSKIITNTLFAITILVVLPWSLNQAEDFINAGKSGNSTTISQSTKIYKANITDLYAIDEDGWETKNPEKRNYISDDASIDLINILETVDTGGIFKSSPLSDDGQDILNKKLISESDEQEVTDLENNLFMDDEAYYRYAWHPIFMMLELGTLALVLFLTMFKTAQLILEMAVVKVFLTTAALTDLEEGQRNKKAVEKLRNIVVVLFMMMPLISIYLLLTDYVNSMDISSASKLVILLAAGVFVIDGPNFVEELFGVDAGLKSMSRSLMGMYAGAKATGSLAKGTVKGIKNVGKATKSTVKGMGNVFSRREGERGLDGFKEKKADKGKDSSDKDNHSSNDTGNEKKKSKEWVDSENRLAILDNSSSSEKEASKSEKNPRNKEKMGGYSEKNGVDDENNRLDTETGLGSFQGSPNSSLGESVGEKTNSMLPRNMKVNTPKPIAAASKRMKKHMEKMQGPIASLPNMLSGEQPNGPSNNALGSLARDSINPSSNRDTGSSYSVNAPSEITEPSRNMNNTLGQMQGPIRSPLSFFNVPELKGENGLSTSGRRNISPSNYVKSNQDYSVNTPAFYQNASSSMKEQIGRMQGPIHSLPTRLGNESNHTPSKQTGSSSQFASGNTGRVLNAVNRTSTAPMNNPGVSGPQRSGSPIVAPMSAPQRVSAAPLSNPGVNVGSSSPQKSGRSIVAPMSAPQRVSTAPMNNPGVNVGSGSQPKSGSPTVAPVSAPARTITAPTSTPVVKSVNVSSQKTGSPRVAPVSAPARTITVPTSSPGVHVGSGRRQRSESPRTATVSAPNRTNAAPIRNPEIKAGSSRQPKSESPRNSKNNNNKKS
ncbi:pLS20_p028 family conjugation system transmembrane protein [Bacillus sp. Au-Bac7]|uniref:pLS20_p028 family conjugation system transmembrane protein n=1 Tax=Bacillus sp. Au-Bac7 TaxID=2906458 RepID=UPI001E418119|nr:hypothetical protein [Bacillus sp. Au-Bac7]MCE4051677.1 hypothetical protein [Bacillus sp. Au-Bac7]